MRTTVMIDDAVMEKLERVAAARGQTLSQIVEAAIRLLLARQAEEGGLPPLPTFRSQGTLVDVADRNALGQAMEER